VERLKVESALHDGLGAQNMMSFGFGLTTAGYTAADVDEQNFQMVDPLKALQEYANNANAEVPGQERYLNIFRMEKNKDVLHQIGAAVRGGPTDPQCNNQWPCTSRFDEFFAKYADANGRIYAKQLGNIASNIYMNGWHGVAASNSLFTSVLGFTGREFLALAGWLVCFGQKDANGNRYLPLDWAKTMEMDGVFPSKWKKRGTGNPEGGEWGPAQILDVIDIWRKQGVQGISGTLQLQTFLREMLNIHGSEGNTLF